MCRGRKLPRTQKEVRELAFQTPYAVEQTKKTPIWGEKAGYITSVAKRSALSGKKPCKRALNPVRLHRAVRNLGWEERIGSQDAVLRIHILER